MCDKNAKWEESSEEESNYGMHEVDSNDEEECYYASELAPKLQFRKYVSTACWNEQMEMAEVLENKGRLWTTTGIVRCGKIYCSVEETLFLIEIGALVLMNESGNGLSLKELYGKVAGGKNGCSWEQFEVYRHLKSLGYIVGRHGVSWSVKKVKNYSESVPSQSSLDKNGVLEEESKDMKVKNYGDSAPSQSSLDKNEVLGEESKDMEVKNYGDIVLSQSSLDKNRVLEEVSKDMKVNSALSQSSLDKNGVLEEESKDMDSINRRLSEMQISLTRPIFDVYRPNSKFRKSFPGDPSFIICLAREYPPRKEEIEAIERQCGSVPLKFSVVEHGRVSIFSFDKGRPVSQRPLSSLSQMTCGSCQNRSRKMLGNVRQSNLFFYSDSHPKFHVDLDVG